MPIEDEDARVPRIHKSTYKVFFLREEHEHLYTNSRHPFFAGVSKILCVYLSVLRIK